MPKITEENYLSLTIEYLEEFQNDLESFDAHKHASDVRKLIKYLNKTN